MEGSAETSPIMAISTTEETTKKLLKTKRRESQKLTTPPATPKMEASKEKEQSSRYHQLQANKVELKIMMMERKRKLKHPARKSD
jgi:hypothetical protein